MKFTLLVIILAVFIAVITYGAINWQKYGTLWGQKMKDVETGQLIGFGNLYDGKNICTKGYLIQMSTSIVIKQNLSNDILNNSIWVNNVSGKSFFVDGLGENKAAPARVCGKYQSGRGKGFGQPSIWNQQIDVSDFELLGKTTVLSE